MLLSINCKRTFQVLSKSLNIFIWALYRILAIAYSIRGNSGNSTTKGSLAWNFVLNSGLGRKNFTMVYWMTVASIVNVWPTTVTCLSHRMSSFMYNVVGIIDSLSRVYRCQQRFVNKHFEGLLRNSMNNRQRHMCVNNSHSHYMKAKWLELNQRLHIINNPML